MADMKSAISAIRFGYGLGRGYGGATTPAALLGELERAIVVPQELAAKSSGERLKQEVAMRRERLRTADAGDKPARRRIAAQILAVKRADYVGDAHRKMAAAVASPAPFFERLVAFWSNHFTVSAKNVALRALVGPYEIEAIRPHVMGAFGDMLLAAETHPAMLLYLDQQSSVGPNSPVGKRDGLGLNENLARECLELHTLGVGGGYGQADVTALAAIMAGWSVARAEGRVRFRENRAEPGSKTLLGRTYPGGEADLPAALGVLAGRPATAQRIAGKLARHFLAPAPREHAVAALASTFLHTKGSLPDVYRTLVELPEAWHPTGTNVKTHHEFVVSALRASDVEIAALGAIPGGKRPRPNPLSLGALVAMNQQPWRAPSPAGWPEDPQEWLSPAGLAGRLNWLAQLIPHIGDAGPRDFADRILGPAVSKRTRDVLAAASNREEGLALVLASPEFNRR